MHNRKNILYAIILIMVALLSGCRSGNKKVNPAIGQVDLKIWLVLATGEFIGDGFNRGCRLNFGEVRQRVDHLQSNGTLFGANTTINWDNFINVITDPTNSVLPREEWAQNINFWLSPTFSVWLNFFYDQNKINVYFIGNAQGRR